MINSEMVIDLISKTHHFITKRGQDINARKELIQVLNQFSDNALDTIYINNIDNFNIPDVVVLPLYNNDFASYALNPENPETCPFGYTIEIHQRCFDYPAEWLAAILIHDILQNVQSDTARIRFMKAYNATISQYPSERILNLFSDISNSEVIFIMFMEICCRPFKVPVGGDDYTGTGDVLKAIGLDDAYDAYLEKTLPASIDDPEDRINQEIANDFRDVETIVKSCMDKDIRHYYTMIKNGVPLVSLDHILSTPKTSNSLGFISRKRNIRRKYDVDTPPSGDSMNIITESYMNPKTEIDIRYQIDRIIGDIRYCETEAEREVILFKIKTLRLKLLKTKESIQKRLQKGQNNKDYEKQLAVVQTFDDELNILRDKVANMEIKQKVWRVYTKMDLPEGYQF